MYNRYNIGSMGVRDEAIRRAIYVWLFFSPLLSIMSSTLSSIKSINGVDQSELGARCVRGEAATYNWLRWFFPKGRIFQAILTEYLASSKEH